MDDNIRKTVYFDKRIGRLIERRPRGRKPVGSTNYVQAKNIVNLFGGYVACAEALGIPNAEVSRWLKPRTHRDGADGLIPQGYINHLSRMARYHGILIPPEAWCPFPNTLADMETEKIPSTTAQDIIQLLYGDEIND